MMMMMMIIRWLGQSIFKTISLVGCSQRLVKWCNNRWTGDQGLWVPNAHRCTWGAKTSPSGPISEKSCCSSGVRTHSALWSVVYGAVELQTGLPSKAPIMACVRQNWTVGQWKKVPWSDESWMSGWTTGGRRADRSRVGAGLLWHVPKSCCRSATPLQDFLMR